MGRTSSQVKQRYNEKAYDEIKVRVPKGQREEVKAYCESRNESVNGFFLRAMKETMERDKAPQNAE